ncbi:hypothetical protein BJX61DRAFT_539517 [Aspergillus egyptiacus]|nr:hypothetical protein BJX61DRAFT_539517 [Aspergillus egyptiacus]
MRTQTTRPTFPVWRSNSSSSIASPSTRRSSDPSLLLSSAGTAASSPGLVPGSGSARSSRSYDPSIYHQWVALSIENNTSRTLRLAKPVLRRGRFHTYNPTRDRLQDRLSRDAIARIKILPGTMVNRVGACGRQSDAYGTAGSVDVVVDGIAGEEKVGTVWWDCAYWDGGGNSWGWIDGAGESRDRRRGTGFGGVVRGGSVEGGIGVVEVGIWEEGLKDDKEKGEGE